MASKPTIRTITLLIAAWTLAAQSAESQTFNFHQEGYRWSFVNGHVYRLTPQPMTWDGARLYAQNHSIGGVQIPGSLVTIRSQEENDWLLNPDADLLYNVEKNHHWIGFTDNGRFSEEGVWVWVSGEPGQYREDQGFCSRYCNFLSQAIVNRPTPDYAVIQDERGNFPGFWFPDINTSAIPNGPWHGIVEFVPPFPGAFQDNNGDNIPDLWEDNNQNGIPDGYEDGPPVPSPRNLRVGGGGGVNRLVWEPAFSPDLLGYRVQRTDENIDFENWTTISGESLLLSNEFIDDGSYEFFFFPSDRRTYRVEAIFNIEGQLRRSFSNIASGNVNVYVISLPAVQTPPGSDNLVRYPISVLNARGIIASGFEINVLLPSIVDLSQGVGAEKTALTDSFPSLQLFVDPTSRAVTITTNFSTQPDVPLNGEGALVDLFFRVQNEAPIGAVGDVAVEYAYFHTGPGETSPVDVEDLGSIAVRPGFSPGDTDGDGILSANDFVVCASLALGVVPPTLRSYYASDLNGDGVVDILDVTLLRTLLAGRSGGGTFKEKAPAAKGPSGNFELKMKDAAFPAVPGEVDMEVVIEMPEGELDGIAGAGFTINYATEHVILKGIELEGDSFDVLFYDQRDYLRGWKPGRAKVVVSSEDNKIVNGSVAKVKFESTAMPMVPSTDVPVTDGKMAKSSGANVAWTSVVELEEGTLLFPGPPGLDINIVVDDVIDAKDLLEFIELIKTSPQEGSILYEFSKEWLTPR